MISPVSFARSRPQSLRPNTRSRAALVIAPILALLAIAAGCQEKDPQYGVEKQLILRGKPQVWAIAPVINLSGQKGVDPLLQADLVYGQMQQVRGLTVIPVDRVVEVYMALHIEKVDSPAQAGAVCDALSCDGLIVPSVTLFDPYDPPKLGAVLALFPRKPNLAAAADAADLARRAAPPDSLTIAPAGFVQSVGEFDANNGSIRQAVNQYAAGRMDPAGPLGSREYLVDMDRFCSFGYHSLIRDLLFQVSDKKDASRVDQPADHAEAGDTGQGASGRHSRMASAAS